MFKLKSFGTAKETINKMKRQLTELAKTFVNNATNKGLISKCKTAHAVQYKKKNTTQLKKWAEDLNRYFSKGDLQMAKKHLKTCSTLQIIRERQVKTTIKYHLTLGRMIIIQKKKKKSTNKCWRGCEEKGAFLHCWWECKLVRTLWGTV